MHRLADIAEISLNAFLSKHIPFVDPAHFTRLRQAIVEVFTEMVEQSYLDCKARCSDFVVCAKNVQFLVGYV